MAETYKLTYFPITALAEPIRWLLALNDIQFEDIRIEMADWPKHKPDAPYGKLPILEVNGKKMTQTSAICRCLAKKADLAGSDASEAAEIDIIVDTIGDFKTALVDYYWDSDEERKAAKKGPLQETTVPFYLSRFDKTVGENGGYFVRGKLSWADIFFVATSDWWQMLSGGMDFYTDYPNLAQLKKKVVEIPQIKQWIAKRPPNKKLR